MQIRGLERTVLPEYGCKGIPESAEKAYNAGLKRKARIHSQRKKALYGLKCVILGELIEPNQVLALALAYDVDAIVHEDLRSLPPPSDEGALSWELSSWARRDVIENIEYRAASAGLAVERVYPAGTSRSRPRCGSTGHTCKSPDHQQEHWWGGQFRCNNARCGFEGNREYIGR